MSDAHRDALRQLIHSAKNNTELEKALTEPHEFKVNELTVCRLDGSVPLVLERTLTDVTALRVAPAGVSVAFLRGEKLVIASLANGAKRLVAAEKAMGHFDWTPDGKALLYAVPLAEKWDASGINLFRLERRTVMDEHGVLVAGVVQPLAQAAANFEPRVRCLPDGRVLFASLALQLPAAADAKPPTHFYLANTMAAPVIIPTPADVLPQDLAAFAPSPDGRRIAVVNCGDDKVSVVDMASGTVETIAPQRVGKSRALPAWRGTNELYFATFPAADAKRPEWLRWSPGAAPQIISRSWNDGSVTNLIEK
jgi:hypothetical protein